MKKFEYKGKQWHEECFSCMVCKEPIRNKSFIPRDEQVICVPCYERDFAQKCTKCAGVNLYHIHQAFSRTVFVFFYRFCEFECNTTSDWLNHVMLHSNTSKYRTSGEQD